MLFTSLRSARPLIGVEVRRFAGLGVSLAMQGGMNREGGLTLRAARL